MIAVAASLIDFDGFLAAATAVNTAMITQFGAVFVLTAFAAVLLIAAIFISPLGAVRIGGDDAKPILKRWNWFAITLCTTIATGILFWGAAEPMFHLTAPPPFADVEPHSPQAAQFALSSVFLHWTFTPYAIYTTAALAFALAHYNHGGPYSLGAILGVLHPGGEKVWAARAIDAAALFSLVAGVAASLGAGVLTLTDGLGAIMGAPDTIWTRLGVTAIVVLVYVASSLTGLQRGIKILSDWNIRLFFFLCAFIFLAGPTTEILRLMAHGAGQFVTDFVPASLGVGGRLGSAWTRDWTVFAFSNWLAWAPITALFLGRIAIGYTVRDFITVNMLAPSLFGLVWMGIFGGAAIAADGAGDGALGVALARDGPEGVIYALLETLPFVAPIILLFVFATFISFVTAMDSNTHAIAGVALKPSAPGGLAGRTATGVKIFWGALIGAVSWLMTATHGIDGVRMLSNLGGAPGLVVLWLCAFALIRMLIGGAAFRNARR